MFKNISIAVICAVILSACSNTTTYKAKSQGWNDIIEAKTIAYAEPICNDKHYGYLKSYQYEKWNDYNHGNYYEYDSVEFICYDGYTLRVPIDIISGVVSPRVAEIMKQKEKEEKEGNK